MNRVPQSPRFTPANLFGSLLPEFARVDDLARALERTESSGLFGERGVGGVSSSVATRPRTGFWIRITDQSTGPSPGGSDQNNPPRNYYSWKLIYAGTFDHEINGTPVENPSSAGTLNPAFGQRATTTDAETIGGLWEMSAMSPYDAGGLPGTNFPAIEINGRTDVPFHEDTGTIVWAELSLCGSCLYFSYASAPDGGNVTYTSVTVEENLTLEGDYVTEGDDVTLDNDTYNEYTLNVYLTFIANSDYDFTLNSFAVGVDGQRALLVNRGPRVGRITHQHAGSTAATRVICPYELDLLLPTNFMAELIYDGGTVNRWRVLSVSDVMNPGTESGVLVVDGAMLALPINVQRPTQLFECEEVDEEDPPGILGIDATGVPLGYLLRLVNLGPDDCFVGNQDALADAGNRVVCPGAVPFPLRGGYGMTLVRGPDRWYVLAHREMIAEGQVAYGGTNGELIGDSGLTYDGEVLTYGHADPDTLAGFDGTRGLESVGVGTGLELDGGTLNGPDVEPNEVGFGDADGMVVGDPSLTFYPGSSILQQDATGGYPEHYLIGRADGGDQPGPTIRMRRRHTATYEATNPPDLADGYSLGRWLFEAVGTVVGGIYATYDEAENSAAILLAPADSTTFLRVRPNGGVVIGDVTADTPAGYGADKQLISLTASGGGVVVSGGNYEIDYATLDYGEIADGIGLDGYLAIANNLSDLDDASDARDNLELGTGDSPRFAAVGLGCDVAWGYQIQAQVASDIRFGARGTNGFVTCTQFASVNDANDAYQKLAFDGDGIYLNQASNKFVICGTINPPSSPNGPGFYLGTVTANPTGLASNSAGIFAKDVSGTAELFAIDSAGNVTQLSSHAEDGPAEFYRPGERAWVLRDENDYAGETRWIDLAGLAEEVQKLTGRKLIHVERKPPALDWDSQQEAEATAQLARVQAQRARYREWSARLDAWLLLPAEDRAATPRPEEWAEEWLRPHEYRDKPRFLQDTE